MTVFQRIQSLCDAKNIKITALESELGFAHSSLSDMSKTNIRSDRLLKVAQYFHVSTDWLLTGESGERLSFGEWKLIDQYRQMDDETRKSIADYIAFLESHRQSIKDNKKTDNSEELERA